MTIPATRTLTEREFGQHADPLNAGRLPIGTSPTPRHFLVLAGMLEASGYGSSKELAHLSELHQAATIAAGAIPPSRPVDDMDPAKTSAAEAAHIIRNTALNILLAQSTSAHGGALQAFEAKLLPYAEGAFTLMAEAAVTAMQAEFTEAVEVCVAAHGAEITAETTGAGIAVDATSEQIEAWRALGPAVDTLNRIADLRIRVHHLLDWQRHDSDGRAVACFISGDVDEDTLESAANRYRGTIETVLVRSDFPNVGPAAKQAARPRTGGPWLDLIDHGYTLRLATPSEVQRRLNGDQ
jgi:hypothetical protein